MKTWRQPSETNTHFIRLFGLTFTVKRRRANTVFTCKAKERTAKAALQQSMLYWSTIYWYLFIHILFIGCDECVIVGLFTVRDASAL